jgi:hypothetical protein
MEEVREREKEERWRYRRGDKRVAYGFSVYLLYYY